MFNVDGMLYPDSLVGTDSHTTMINGLGVLGWGEWEGCCMFCMMGMGLGALDKSPEEEVLISLWEYFVTTVHGAEASAFI